MSSSSAEPIVAEIVKHYEYYIKTGDTAFLVENVLFRVHKYFFIRESPVFRYMFAQPALPGQPQKGATDENAFIIDDVPSNSFALLLWAFYNPKLSIYDATISEWIQILKLAHDWEFGQVKQLAIRELEKLEIEPVLKISVYQKYNINRYLLIPSYIAICTRSNLINEEEGNSLGMKTVLRIVAARERMILSHPFSIESMYAIIMETFELGEVYGDWVLEEDTFSAGGSEETVFFEPELTTNYNTQEKVEPTESPAPRQGEIAAEQHAEPEGASIVAEEEQGSAAIERDGQGKGILGGEDHEVVQETEWPAPSRGEIAAEEYAEPEGVPIVAGEDQGSAARDGQEESLLDGENHGDGEAFQVQDPQGIAAVEGSVPTDDERPRETKGREDIGEDDGTNAPGDGGGTPCEATALENNSSEEEGKRNETAEGTLGNGPEILDTSDVTIEEDNLTDAITGDTDVQSQAGANESQINQTRIQAEQEQACRDRDRNVPDANETKPDDCNTESTGTGNEGLTSSNDNQVRGTNQDGATDLVELQGDMNIDKAKSTTDDQGRGENEEGCKSTEEGQGDVAKEDEVKASAQSTCGIEADVEKPKIDAVAIIEGEINNKTIIDENVDTVANDHISSGDDEREDGTKQVANDKGDITHESLEEVSNSGTEVIEGKGDAGGNGQESDEHGASFTFGENAGDDEGQRAKNVEHTAGDTSIEDLTTGNEALGSEATAQHDILNVEEKHGELKEEEQDYQQNAEGADKEIEGGERMKSRDEGGPDIKNTLNDIDKPSDNPEQQVVGASNSNDNLTADEPPNPNQETPATDKEVGYDPLPAWNGKTDVENEVIGESQDQKENNDALKAEKLAGQVSITKEGQNENTKKRQTKEGKANEKRRRGIRLLINPWTDDDDDDDDPDEKFCKSPGVPVPSPSIRSFLR